MFIILEVFLTLTQVCYLVVFINIVNKIIFYKHSCELKNSKLETAGKSSYNRLK